MHRRDYLPGGCPLEKAAADQARFGVSQGGTEGWLGCLAPQDPGRQQRSREGVVAGGSQPGPEPGERRGGSGEIMSIERLHRRLNPASIESVPERGPGRKRSECRQ